MGRYKKIPLKFYGPLKTPAKFIGVNRISNYLLMEILKGRRYVFVQEIRNFCNRATLDQMNTIATRRGLIS